MNKKVITLLLVFIMAMGLSASETLFNVSTINSYNLKNDAIVSIDYDQNSIAELFLFDIQSKTKSFIPMYDSYEPDFLLSGFNGKEIVGHSLIQYIDSKWVLGALIVKVEFREQGIGKALLNAAEHAAKENGATSMTLHVFANNTRARHVYEKLGYTVISKNKDWDGSAYYEMEKIL